MLKPGFEFSERGVSPMRDVASGGGYRNKSLVSTVLGASSGGDNAKRGGAGKGSRTVIAPSIAALTNSQVHAASELFCQMADGSVGYTDVVHMLTALNLLPPPMFNITEAVDSVDGGPLNDQGGGIDMTTFLYLVNGIWVAHDEAVSHEVTVKNTFEAFHARFLQQQQNSGGEDAADGGSSPQTVAASRRVTSTAAAGGSSSAFKHGGEETDATTTSSSDPVQMIVQHNVNRGYRNLQQFLSPSQGEPELLKAFIRLGALDTGAGYSLDISRMQSRAESLGISPQDASTIAHLFDDDQSGEIDYDEYLNIMKTDLASFGLKPRVLDHLRRLLFGPSKQPDASPQRDVEPLSMAAAAAAVVAVASKGAAAPPPPAAPKVPAMEVPRGGGHRKSKQHTNLRSNSNTMTVLPHFVVDGPPQGFNNNNNTHSTHHHGAAAGFHRQSRIGSMLPVFEPFSMTGSTDDMAMSVGGAADDEDSMTLDAFSNRGGLGRSLFHTMSMRQPSVHELHTNAPHWMMQSPVAFYAKLQEDLSKCRGDLDGLKQYERDAARIQRQASDINGEHKTSSRQRDRRLQRRKRKNQGKHTATTTTTTTTTVKNTSDDRSDDSADDSTCSDASDTHRRHGSLSASAGGQHQPDSLYGGSLPPIPSARFAEGTTTSATDPLMTPLRKYGRGKNPALPAYRYGVPPPPLRHHHHKAVTSRHMESHLRYESILTPRMTHRVGGDHCGGLAPRPPQLKIEHDHPPPPPPLRDTTAAGTRNDAEHENEPVGMSELLHSDNSHDEKLSKRDEPAASAGNEAPCQPLKLLSDDDAVKAIVGRLADTDETVEEMSPLSRQGTGLEGSYGLPSPRHFPSHPQHGSSSSGGAHVRREGSRGGGASLQSKPSNNRIASPRGVVGQRHAAPSPSSAAAGSASSIRAWKLDDTIADPHSVPIEIGRILHRDRELNEKLFDAKLNTGNLCGVVVERRLKKNPEMATALYQAPVPKLGVV